MQGTVGAAGIEHAEFSKQTNKMGKGQINRDKQKH